MSAFQRPLMYNHTIQLILDIFFDPQKLRIPNNLIILNLLSLVLFEPLQLYHQHTGILIYFEFLQSQPHIITDFAVPGVLFI